MQIPILADVTKEISASYGTLLKDAGIALRGLFIIDPAGTLQQATINNLPVGRDGALRAGVAQRSAPLLTRVALRLLQWTRRCASSARSSSWPSMARCVPPVGSRARPP